MTDPAVPQRLAFEKRLAELERQVRELQRTPILTSASITGSLRVRDAAGDEVVRMGDLGTGYGLDVLDSSGGEVVRLGELNPGDYGLRILSPTGQVVFQVTDEGWRRPFFPIPVALQGLQVPTTSASYQVLGYAHFTISGRYLRWALTADPPAAHTMDTRLRLEVFRGGPYPVYTLWEGPDTSFVGHAGTADLVSIVTAVDPWGAEAALYFEARRTGGASPVNIRIPEHPYLFGTV